MLKFLQEFSKIIFLIIVIVLLHERYKNHRIFRYQKSH